MSKDFVLENIELFNELEAVIQYTFSNKEKLLLALTHSSFANERKNLGLVSNERLEFLGDAVLNIVTSEYIYTNFPSLPEGEMTKARAAIVCESSLMKCAASIELGKYLFLGKGEENTGGRNRSSVLSDAFEALIGSIYLDGGMAKARAFILRAMKELLEDYHNNELFIDYKTQLQELIQRHGDRRIGYKIIDEKGPDHDKVFVAQVCVEDQIFGQGKGKNKKEAEQNAAKEALEKNR